MRLTLAITLLLIGATSSRADERLPVPDEASQAKAASLVQELFGTEIKEATTHEKQAALVKKLLQEAARPDTGAGGRYALLTTALDHALDATVAATVVDEIASHYQIDPLQEKSSAVWRMSKSAKTKAQHQSVVEVALELVDLWTERDAYDPAMAAAEIAVNAARDARDGSLVSSTKAKLAEVESQRVQYEQVRQAMEILDKEPTNAEANFQVGSYLCFVKRDWERGLPLLALGNHADLKQLAMQELSKTATSNEQTDLADKWYELAHQDDDPNRDMMLLRASYWYQLSLKSEPALSRLVQLKVEKRLDELGDLSDANEFITSTATQSNLAPLRIANLADFTPNKDTPGLAGPTGYGGPFKEYRDDGSPIVGFIVKRAGFGVNYRNMAVSFLQPIYLVDGKPTPGKAIGNSTKVRTTVELVARDGYAVAGMRVVSHSRVNEVQLIYARIAGTSLDMKDSYNSEWVGSGKATEWTRIGGNGRKIVGIFGIFTKQVRAIGLLQKDNDGWSVASVHTPPTPAPAEPSP